MVTLGDVFAVIASLVGIGLTSWALIVSFGLLFPTKAEIASSALREGPGRSFLFGLLMTGVFGVLGVGALSNPLPGVKLFGWILVLGVMALAAVGGAGLSILASDRVRNLDPSLTPYAGFVRASAYLVTGSMLPILGWFAFGPVALVCAVGAGTKAMLVRSRQALSAGAAQ